MDLDELLELARLGFPVATALDQLGPVQVTRAPSRRPDWNPDILTIHVACTHTGDPLDLDARPSGARLVACPADPRSADVTALLKASTSAYPLLRLVAGQVDHARTRMVNGRAGDAPTELNFALEALEGLTPTTANRRTAFDTAAPLLPLLEHATTLVTAARAQFAEIWTQAHQYTGTPRWVLLGAPRYQFMANTDLAQAYVAARPAWSSPGETPRWTVAVLPDARAASWWAQAERFGFVEDLGPADQPMPAGSWDVLFDLTDGWPRGDRARDLVRALATAAA